MASAQGQVERLQQEAMERGRSAAQSEAKRDSLQAELEQVLQGGRELGRDLMRLCGNVFKGMYVAH